MTPSDFRRAKQLAASLAAIGGTKTKKNVVKKPVSLSEKLAALGKPKPVTVIEKPVYLGKPGEKGDRGDKGDKGNPGYTPIKGKDYFDGKDGKDAVGIIPETGSSIAEKLNTLEGAIDSKVIKGLPAEFDVKQLKAGGKYQLELRDIKGARLDMNDQRWHGGGLSTVSHDSTLTGNGTPSSPLSVVGGGGSGTVQTVSVASANGLAGTSDGDPANPTLTLSTTISGLLKGNGTAISTATAGTDYQAPITLTTSGTSGNATFTSNILNIPNYTYVLPTASTTVLGGVKVDGMTITISGGVISATSGGSGDVTGPGSSTDNAVARFDGTTGKIIQNSAVTIADTSGNITGGTYNGNTIGAGSTSGTNTGDQTITLTGDVTGTGTGSFATTIKTDVALAGNPTTTTQTAGNNTTRIATTAFVTAAVAAAGGVTSVSGTANRITSTGGTTPVIDIAATYVGQTSLTTLGTVATGIWSATTIAVNKGGTGQTTYTDGQLLIGNSTGNTLTKATLTAGSGISITNGSGSITIAATGGGTGLTWNEVTGTSQTASVNNGYITNNAGLVTVTLPSTASVGDVVRIAGKGAGGWKVAQNASGVIHFDGTDTTIGTGGSLASTVQYDAVELLCIVANTGWSVISSVGNITLV